MDAPLSPASLETAGSSMLVLIGLLAGVVEMLIGVVIGWWLRSGKKAHGAGHDNPHLHHAEHALSSLHELTHQVKADVGAHSTAVESISSELAAQAARNATR